MRLGFMFSIIVSVWLAVPAFAQTVCAPVVLSSIDIQEETAGYSVDVEYPVLCQPEARRVIRDEVNRSMNAFKHEFPEHDLSEYPHKHELITDYAVWKAGQGRYASVKLQVMVYTGGAHPNHWPVTWVFDMTDGMVLCLPDVFVDVDAALGRIAPLVRGVLRDKLGQMAFPDMLDPGTAPESVNYQAFIFTEEGVAFFFAPYQVAPYAAGQQVVTIPWAQVNDLLVPGVRDAQSE